MGLIVGRVYHQVDEKNRIRIPMKFKPLFSRGEQMYFVRYKQGRVSVMPESKLTRIMELINNTNPSANGLLDDAISSMVGFIDEVTFDGQGRTQLPEWVRTEANIKKDIVTLGLDTSLEIWDKETYDNQIANMPASQVNGVIYDKKEGVEPKPAE